MAVGAGCAAEEVPAADTGESFGCNATQQAGSCTGWLARGSINSSTPPTAHRLQPGQASAQQPRTQLAAVARRCAGVQAAAQGAEHVLFCCFACSVWSLCKLIIVAGQARIGTQDLHWAICSLHIWIMRWPVQLHCSADLSTVNSMLTVYMQRLNAVHDGCRLESTGTLDSAAPAGKPGCSSGTASGSPKGACSTSPSAASQKPGVHGPRCSPCALPASCSALCSCRMPLPCFAHKPQHLCTWWSP